MSGCLAHALALCDGQCSRPPLSHQPRAMTDQTTHPPAPSESDVSQFYIPAITSLQERRLRALKHGDTFALFNHYGDIVPFRGAPDGLYHCATRYLSHLELRI